MTKQITFHSEFSNYEISHPIAASRFVPNWYRKMDGVIDGIMTVKKCVPFLDSFAIGYMIPLPIDVTWNSDMEKFVSSSDISVYSKHDNSQVEGVEVPEGFSRVPHKWLNNWHIKTPKGYSTLFVHPLNRYDLPFQSITGVVDTDTHPLVINFPFFLKKDFSGKILAGTPMIQAIPFKRDSWKSKVIDDTSYRYPYHYKVTEPPFGFYKRNFWKRKEFK